MAPTRASRRFLKPVESAIGNELAELVEVVLCSMRQVDLRRSFGERWASRVMPNVRQVLVRHENIQTTLRFYVGQNAKRTSAILWEAHRAQAVGATSDISPTTKNAQDSASHYTAER
jgi:hypothetical protein